MARKKENAEQKRLGSLLVEMGKDPGFTKGGLSGVPAIAAHFAMSGQGVYKWKYSGRIPIEKAREIERVTQGRFSRQLLCPWAYV